MTITQLQYAVAIAEYKNFTLAAEKSFVTQPTLSMQILKLEEGLGVKIFDRNTKPIQLTKIGEVIINQAKNILNESNRIQVLIEQEKGYVGGEFKVGVIPTVMPTLLPMFLKGFIKKYPNVNLNIEELTTVDLIKKIKDGTLDAAIASTPLLEDGIKERVLYYEPFVGYFPNQNINKKTITPSDIDVQNLLLLQDGHCFTNGILNICKSNDKSKVEGKPFYLNSGSFETLIKLSNDGLGITLLPYLHTLDLSMEYKENLVEFKDPKPSREVSLIYSTNQLKLHIVDALYSCIMSVVRGAIAFHDVNIISPKLK